jgi:hypothetical protein
MSMSLTKHDVHCDNKLSCSLDKNDFPIWYTMSKLLQKLYNTKINRGAVLVMIVW